MASTSENRRKQYRSAAVVLMGVGACAITYVFHAHLRVGTIFTHLFYVPIVLSSLWWGWRGIATAVVLAALLFASSFLFRGGETIGEDLLRATVFVVVSVVVAVLREGIAAKQHSLRRLASRLSSAEELQRRQIAANLHDRVAQDLALSRNKLGQLRAEADQADPARTSALAEAMGLLDHAIQDTRELTFELCPPMLYELGLAAALDWLAERTRRRHGLAAEFTDDGQPKPLDEDVQALLFRGAQELLANVVKHARADRARMDLSRQAERVVLTVTDDGVGTAVAKAARASRTPEGFGLLSLRERISYVGGRVEISSSGGGTRVTLTVPLGAAPSPDEPEATRQPPEAGEETP